MRTVNIHEAKTHLSRLLEEAVKGEPFIIAKAGKPSRIFAKLNAVTEKDLLSALRAIRGSGRRRPGSRARGRRRRARPPRG